MSRTALELREETTPNQNQSGVTMGLTKCIPCPIHLYKPYIITTIEEEHSLEQQRPSPDKQSTVLC